MRSFLKIVVLLLFPAFGYSQLSKIDSLKAAFIIAPKVPCGTKPPVIFIFTTRN